MTMAKTEITMLSERVSNCVVLFTEIKHLTMSRLGRRE